MRESTEMERLTDMTMPPNPFMGMAMGLHNHTPDDECDDTCTFYPAVPTNDHESETPQ